MHDKQVRRRRAVLALLVAVSLILLTAYFGESPSSPLHTRAARDRRGALADPGGRQQGAQAGPRRRRLVLDTFHAKAQRRPAAASRSRQLSAELAQADGAPARTPSCSQQVGLDNSIDLGPYNRSPRT